MLSPAKISIVSILVLTIVVSPTPSQAAVRTVKVALIGATTRDAGALGQPVTTYHAPVRIGTPGKVFDIQFDVGFNEHFVPHYKPNPFKINLHYDKGYQCNDSSSCVENPNELSIDYQHCKLTGKSYQDIFTLENGERITLGPTNGSLASSSAKPVSTRQTFFAITEASDARFRKLPVDGFFGLGPMAHSGSGAVNILSRLKEDNHIDNAQFSMRFNSDHAGELIFGGADESSYQGEISWHYQKILTAVQKQWSLNLHYVSLGNQIVSCSGQQCQALLSSTINEFYGPLVDVQKIYSMLSTTHQASGLELIDCRRIPDLPNLTFTVGEVPYSLPPSSYIRKTTDGIMFGNETCYVAILPTDSANSKQWVLGTNFLSAYYSIFDIASLRIGFASLR